MKTINVKALMVPLAEYATVSEEATLYEAVQALERPSGSLIRADTGIGPSLCTTRIKES